jgi:hypothetical protein
MLITIISCDYLNLSLENEYVGDVTIPTQVIEYNQNFLQADQVISIQIKLNYIYNVYIHIYLNKNVKEMFTDKGEYCPI